MDSTVGLAAELSAPAPAPRLSTFTPGASANSFCDTQSEVDSQGESVRQSAVAAAAAGSSEAAGNAGPHDSKKKKAAATRTPSAEKPPDRAALVVANAFTVREHPAVGYTCVQ